MTTSLLFDSASAQTSAGDAISRIAALEAENAALRGRVGELENALARARAEVGPAEPDAYAGCSRHVLVAVLDRSPSIIFVKDMEGRYILMNQRFMDLFSLSREKLIGNTDHACFPHDVAEMVRDRDQAIIDGGVPLQFEETVPIKGEELTFFTIKFPLFDADNRPLGLCGITTEITEKKRVEWERDAMRERMLEAQREAVRELSTPLVPIADGVLAMPLVGRIDQVRAARIMDTLLEGISRQSAHTAILDITGVRAVDADVADALIGAARAARLLGARVVLSGLKPEVARTLVLLGADLGDIATVATLQTAIAHALGGSSRGRASRPSPGR
jgi:rsbT co-antagonist protein RsbR